MDLRDIRMVVTDMDGTLLNSSHQVSERFFELFEALSARGIQFVAASGRQYQSIVDKLPGIAGRMVIIAENGGFARHNGIELVSTPLPQPLRREVLEVLSGVAGTHPVLCSKDNAYVAGYSEAFLETLREYYTDFQVLDELGGYEGEIMKIAVYHFESSERFIYPEVRRFEKELKVKVSGANWVDLSHRNAHKGHALQIVQERFGIGPEQTLVFGDYNNDLEMLGRAHFSYAMANAHPNVLKAAKFRTTSNDDFGVERVLEQLL